MILLQNEPMLRDLYSLAAKVPSFPIMANRLVELAKNWHFSKEVINFYRSFPRDEVFSDKEDLLTRTELVEALRHEQPPKETLLSSEED